MIQVFMSNATNLEKISVLNIKPVAGTTKLLALATVELDLCGVAIVLYGVQLRGDAGKAEVALPQYRDADGSWSTAITLPPQLRLSMGDAVIAAGLAANILKKRR
jgi:hypothetical protein